MVDWLRVNLISRSRGPYRLVTNIEVKTTGAGDCAQRVYKLEKDPSKRGKNHHKLLLSSSLLLLEAEPNWPYSRSL